MVNLDFDNKKKVFFLEKNGDVLFENVSFFEVINNTIFEKLGLLNKKKVLWENINDKIFKDDPIHGITKYKCGFIDKFLIFSRPFESVCDNKIKILLGESYQNKRIMEELFKNSYYLKEKFVMIRSNEINYCYNENYDVDYLNFDNLDEFFKNIKKKLIKNTGKIIKIKKESDNKYYLLIKNKAWNANIVYKLKLKVIDDVYMWNINSQLSFKGDKFLEELYPLDLLRLSSWNESKTRVMN